jgi:hypothetical protein
VSTTSGNSNIIKKISLREGTTIGNGIVATVPPLNGLLVEGSVGIGTSSVGSGVRLGISGGDIEIQEANRGVIMVSPDGTKYRVTVANGGTLSVVAV